MNLHGQIMNLLPMRLGPSDAPLAYKLGHRDARHAAAELALKADAINAQLLAALRIALDALQGAGPLQRANAIAKVREAIASATGEKA